MTRILFLSAVLFLGCKTPDGSTAAKDVPSTTNVTVLDSDNGGSITTSVGQLIVIKLASHNDGGYVWTFDSAAGLNEPVYKHDLSTCDPGAIGCSGFETFTFSTANACVGEYQLKLIEKRFGREPGSIYNLKVTLQ